jgi:hypothetical protein
MTRPAFCPVKPRRLGTPKAAVSELVAQHGGIEQVMVTLGIGKSDAYAWTDPQSPKEMSFARVAALTSPACTAGVEYLAARAGGLFLPMPSACTPIGSLTADSVRRHGVAAAELIVALADGRLSAEEARGALPELDAACAALALLRSTVAEVAGRTGAVPIEES